jgi:hypothetical protein
MAYQRAWLFEWGCIIVHSYSRFFREAFEQEFYLPTGWVIEPTLTSSWQDCAALLILSQSSSATALAFRKSQNDSSRRSS